MIGCIRFVIKFFQEEENGSGVACGLLLFKELAADMRHGRIRICEIGHFPMVKSAPH